MPPYKGPDGRWRFRGTVNGKPYSGSSPKGDNTKKAAVEMEQELLRKLRANAFTGTMPTVEQFAKQFLEFQGARNRVGTHDGQTRHITLHVLPHIGRKRLDDVSQRDIDTIITRWKAGAAVRTVNTRLATMNRMFQLAVEWKFLVHAPHGEPLRVPEDTIRFLTEQEAAALLANARPRWRSMMFVALRTGLRCGELRGLQWSDVDLEHEIVHVRRSDPGIRGREPGPPKGGRHRAVPLTQDAVAALRAERELARFAWRRSAVVPPSARIWPSPRDLNRARTEGGCVKEMTNTLARAGIVDNPGERLGWHTLRHTFASWLVIRGVSLRTIQALLGHASIRQTERYAHLAPNATHHDAVASLDFSLVPSDPQRALNAPSDDNENDNDSGDQDD